MRDPHKVKSRIAFLSISLFLWFGALPTYAQFPGPAGTPGSTAIHKDSPVFTAWASHCRVYRGYMNIANKALGKASIGDSVAATGVFGFGGVVSLGDSGVAVLSFAQPIINGTGPDFAVFENAFSDRFLELAFVEVSSNGADWVRFPATSNMQTDTQIGPFDEKSDARKINNLAGKYRAPYGTPFDLEELRDSSKVNIDSVLYIRIVDVVGSISPAYAGLDKNGKAVNDPFPTPFASSGFDLEAVGVINQSKVVSVPQKVASQNPMLLYPNPVEPGGSIYARGLNKIENWTVFSSEGKVIAGSSLQHVDIPANISPGMYWVHIKASGSSTVSRLLVKTK